jgi:hypothetical protein
LNNKRLRKKYLKGCLNTLNGENYLQLLGGRSIQYMQLVPAETGGEQYTNYCKNSKHQCDYANDTGKAKV